LSRQWASLYSDRFYFENANAHADAFLSPKQTISHRYRNEKNTVNQLQLNKSTNVKKIKLCSKNPSTLICIYVGRTLNIGRVINVITYWLKVVQLDDTKYVKIVYYVMCRAEL